MAADEYCAPDRLEAQIGRLRLLLCLGMALARDPICGEAVTTEGSHSRN